MQIPQRCKNGILLVAFAGCLFMQAGAQNRPRPNTPTTTTTSPDTTRRPPQITPPRTGPRPYREVITDKAVSQKGLFAVHKVDEKWYFEIGDSLLVRDILVVNRIS